MRQYQKRTIDDYRDMLDMEHFESKKHPRMSKESRAAQFAPFAALTGYDDAVKTATQIHDDTYDDYEHIQFDNI